MVNYENKTRTPLNTFPAHENANTMPRETAKRQADSDIQVKSKEPKLMRSPLSACVAYENTMPKETAKRKINSDIQVK